MADEEDSRQKISGQRSDIRGLRSGIKLTSDLRPLISAIDDLNGLNDFNKLTNSLINYRPARPLLL